MIERNKKSKKPHKKAKKQRNRKLMRFLFLAQSEGFEPSVRENRTHDFQSCSFGRSDNSAYNKHYYKQ